MASTLLQLQVVDSEGTMQRDIIVTAAMPLYHLHRVLQFCVKPLQSDDTIAAQVMMECLSAFQIVCTIWLLQGLTAPACAS